MRSTLRREKHLWIIALLPALLLSACGGRLPNKLKMDPNPVLSGGTGWIVISEAYARVKAKPSADSEDISHLRGGETLLVLGRERLPPDQAVWYKVLVGKTEGWIDGSQAAFFETRETAEHAAVRYR